MPQEPAKRSTVEFILTFLALFFLVQFGLRFFFPGWFGGEKPAPAPLLLTVNDTSITEGHHPVLTLRNNTDHVISLPNRCPEPLVDIAVVQHTASGEEVVDVMANQTDVPCQSPAVVQAESSVQIDLGPWKYTLFNEPGRYRASLPIDASGALISDPSASMQTVEFTISEPGFFTTLFRAFITKPLLNGLIFIASYMPQHDLGLSIILLTLIVKLILLVPNQHALRGQKKMQEIQPKLDELKKKYPNDAKRVQEETMKLWKQYKINPLQSCLPMVLQFPILIGLFFVIREGGNIELSRHLLYPAYQDLAWHFDTMFLGLDLTKPNLWLMPPLLVVLQFIQMKMSFSRRKPKKNVIDVNEKKSWIPELNQQTVMLYVLPFMIGFFAIKFPSAVSIYWAVSTLFGIAQQWFVNRAK